MYGTNPYGYGSYGNEPFAQLMNFGSSVGALVIIAIIAAIVLAVMGYKRFISNKNELHLSFKDKKSWGPFLRFDILLIDKILKALYLFNALLVLFVCAAFALSSISFGFGAFLGSLVGMAILCIVLEILLRVGYEFAMLNVMIARNTSDIRRKLFGNGPSAATTEAAPAQDAPRASFCPNCGAPIVPGDHFCGECGHKLD